MRSSLQLVLPAIWLRAAMVWGLTRLMFVVLPLAVGRDPGSIPAPSVGIILLSGVVGIVDVHIRGERILWANLGVSREALYTAYALIAIPAECLIALVVR